MLSILVPIALGGVIYLLGQVCGWHESLSFAYVALIWILPGVIAWRVTCHETDMHRSRRQDPSEVEALFQQAKAVDRGARPMWDDEEETFEKKKEALDGEVRRLRAVGNRGWTEYQVLPLRQMLVDFLAPDALITRANSELRQLQGYAEDTSFRYYWDRYHDWEQAVEDAKDPLERLKTETTEQTQPSGTSAGNSSGGEAADEMEQPKRRDREAYKLRATLRELLEHVAAYEANWAEGSTHIRSITICGVAAVPTFMIIGLLPALYGEAQGGGALGFLNWGAIGIAGALTAVLRDLHNSNLVEVGDTEGKRELWNTIVGAILGFVAGILGYGLIIGGILPQPEQPGGIIPDLENGSLTDVGLSVLWAFAAGLCFESLFERVRAATMGNGR